MATGLFQEKERDKKGERCEKEEKVKEEKKKSFKTEAQKPQLPYKLDFRHDTPLLLCAAIHRPAQV